MVRPQSGSGTPVARPGPWTSPIAQVVFLVRSSSDAPPALVAEAEAVIESIRAEPTETSAGYRLVFELPAGWDNG